jgi:hypothetical protein
VDGFPGTLSAVADASDSPSTFVDAPLTLGFEMWPLQGENHVRSMAYRRSLKSRPCYVCFLPSDASLLNEAGR